MILIADSGSTKTTWAFICNGQLWKCYTSEGLNPLTSTTECIQKTLSEVNVATDGRSVNNIFFYGAGCGTTENQQLVHSQLQSVFPVAKIQVESDLLGACRALGGDKEGLVGILGTGSNACRYDGRKIINKIPSLGYILGDEGSGNHIGRILLKDYFSRKMPVELQSDFRQHDDLELSTVLEKMYHKANPNRYLAQFAKFALLNRQHEYIQKVLHQAFTDFLTIQVLPLGCGTLHLVGSIAHTFKNELRESTLGTHIQIGNIIKEPIEGLILYHSSLPTNSGT